MAVKLLFEVVTDKRIASLGHPNLMGFIAAHEDVSETGKPRFSIVTPFYAGGELFDKIVHLGHFSEHTAAQLFAPVCDAVNTLHLNSIIHR